MKQLEVTRNAHAASCCNSLMPSGKSLEMMHGHLVSYVWDYKETVIMVHS